MKNLITSTACVMILLALVLQFAQNQILHNRLMAADFAVNTFKEAVKQEGCISGENEKWLQERISSILECSSRQVEVSGGRTPVMRGELIEYRIQAPVTEVVAVPGFWGLKNENGFEYKVRRFTTSEYIGRGQ